MENNFEIIKHPYNVLGYVDDGSGGSVQEESYLKMVGEN